MPKRETVHFLVLLTVVVVFAALTLSGCVGEPSRYRPAYMNYPMNELPMYGGMTKSAELIETDRRYVAAIDSTTTRKAAVDELLERARQAIAAGDIGLAMRRTNQAWLLLPQDGRVYHHFAIAMVARRDPASDIDPLWRRALELAPNDPLLQRDWGYYLFLRKDFDASAAAFERAAQLKPDLADIRGLAAMAYYWGGRYAQAWAAVKQARRNGERIPDAFIRDLSQKMPEPN